MAEEEQAFKSFGSPHELKTTPAHLGAPLKKVALLARVVAPRQHHVEDSELAGGAALGAAHVAQVLAGHVDLQGQVLLVPLCRGVGDLR